GAVFKIRPSARVHRGATSRGDPLAIWLRRIPQAAARAFLRAKQHCVAPSPVDIFRALPTQSIRPSTPSKRIAPLWAEVATLAPPEAAQYRHHAPPPLLRPCSKSLLPVQSAAVSRKAPSPVRRWAAAFL